MEFMHEAPLTPEQQKLINELASRILAEWPNLLCGKFETTGGYFQLALTQKRDLSALGKAKTMARFNLWHEQ